ncbi:MAG: SDR family NAD(P)-dependent oxidoreductase [Pseudohongiellaceae bacterium]
MKFENKVAFITGAASGLGFATARRFIAGGACVLLFDLDRDRVEAAAAELGSQALACPGDVTSEETVRDAVNLACERLGGVHINVNCAGVGGAARTVGRDGPMPLDKFERIVRINLIGTFNVLRLCAEQMQKNEPETEAGERGIIINTSSVAGFDGQTGQAAYAASKGGINAMTLPVARDLGKRGIRVMTIAPGVFATPMMAGATPEVREPLIAITQFPNRLGKPEEFAELAAHIVGNSYLNGEVIRLDAGIRMPAR